MKTVIIGFMALLCLSMSLSAQNDSLYLTESVIPELNDFLKSKKPASVVIIEDGYQDLNWSQIAHKLNLLPGLETVVLRSNDLEELPYAFRKLKATMLIMEGNDIEADDQLFALLQKLPYLRRFYMVTTKQPGSESLKFADTPIEKIFLVNENYYNQNGQPDLYKFCSDDPALATQLMVNDGQVDERELNLYYFDNAYIEPSPTPFNLELEELENTNSEIIIDENSPATDTVHAIPFEKIYKNISAPLQGMEPELQRSSIDNNKDQVVLYKGSLTSISIPANTFIDKEGKTIEGVVEIGYREFRTPEEIMFSGIPMNKIQGDSLLYYESAGMFEITASAKGEEVFIDPGKKISISFDVIPTSEQPNFYSFNDSSSVWNDGGQAKMVRLENVPRLEQHLFTQYLELVDMKKSSAAKLDKKNLDERFESTDYVHDQDATESAWRSVEHNGYRAPIGKCVKVSIVHHSEKDGICFKLRTINGCNPECKVFENYIFSYNEGYDYEKFRHEFVLRKGAFNDVRIEGKGSDLTLRLKSRNRITDLNVKCVKRIENADSTIYREVEAPMEAYHRRLAKREQFFNKKIEKHTIANLEVNLKIDQKIELMMDSIADIHGDYLRNYTPMQLANYCDSMNRVITYLVNVNNANMVRNQLLRNSLERLRNNSLMVYATDNANRQIPDNAPIKGLNSYIDRVESNSTSYLSIGTTGVHNLDCLYLLPNSISLMASYRDTLGRTISPKVVYMFIPEINTSISFCTDPLFALNTKKIVVPVLMPFALVAILPNDRAFVFETEARNPIKASSLSFIMKEVKVGGEEWSELMDRYHPLNHLKKLLSSR
jgi:hypothetical protein